MKQPSLRRYAVHGSLAAALALLTTSLAAQPLPGVEGFGAVTRGGEDGAVYHVTSLADSGPGTLRDAIASHNGTPRKVVFDVGGIITISDSLIIRSPNLTIDGSTAPEPGITVRQAVFTAQFVVAGTHDVVVRHIRVRGLYVDGGDTGGQNATLIIDGDRTPDHIARRVVFDHLTVTQAGDSAPDIWGDVEDVTVQWCLFYNSRHPTTVSGPGTRRSISLHHNVYARNGERNPQLRGQLDTLDYVNNVVYGWAAFPSLGNGYGMRIRNEVSEGKVNANIVNNAFVSEAGRYDSWGLVYGDNPGADSVDGGPGSTVPQGTVVTTSRMGSLWVSGNILPAGNRDHYSTVSGRLSAPAVTTWPATQLRANVLPYVGTLHRSLEEWSLLDEVGLALGGVPGPGPSPSPSPSPTPTPTPAPSPTPTPAPSPTPSASPTPAPSPSPTASPTPNGHHGKGHHKGAWERWRERWRDYWRR